MVLAKEYEDVNMAKYTGWQGNLCINIYRHKDDRPDSIVVIDYSHSPEVVLAHTVPKEQS
jgi:hypothetical protein